MPACVLSSPFCNSMLNDAATSIPYPFNAWKNAPFQSRAARLIRGAAVRSVSHLPSLPPASGPLDCAVSGVVSFWELSVTAEIAMPLPALPLVRDTIVKVLPAALAHTPVEPALISSAKHNAMLDAVDRKSTRL